MPLVAGSRLGLYGIVAPLGAGGMGEVYRARDTRLGREVAIKILPEGLDQDPERISRFEREAQSLAALNHPKIATLFGMEQAEGRHFLVMELVEGETLADRLQRGRLPIAETLTISQQIADALEAAHERGIIHRDLKPANVKVTPDDVVKVLDFGLAKALQGSRIPSTPPGSGGDQGSPTPANSPTFSATDTAAGVILGTAAYMSPEQAKGLPADARSDIFSFGCVLFELLTGRKAFPGDTVTEILASILAREPDWAALPSPVDPRVTNLLSRCLAKSRRQRWQAIGDVRAELEFIIAAPQSPALAAAPLPHPLWQRAVVIAATALVAAAISGLGVWRLLSPPAEPKPVTRLSFMFPPGVRFGNPNRSLLAVSPDGSAVVFSTQQGLAIRSMATGQIRTLVEGQALNPTFSPDSRAVAYSLDGALWRINIAGGAPTRLAEPSALIETNWSVDGILVTTGQKILRINPGGGAWETLAEVPEPQRAGVPKLLPGGRVLLFAIAPGPSPSDWEQGQIVAQSIGSGDRHILVKGAMYAEYVRSGHLLYVQGGAILAAPFDVDRLQVTGEAVPVVEGVSSSTSFTGIAQFSVGEEGTLAYVPGPATRTAGQLSVTITDQTGNVTELGLPTAKYATPRFSPDGKSIAFGIDDAAAAIWVYDLSGPSVARRLTFEGRNRYPVWSRDGQRIAFQSERGGATGIYWKRADGSGTDERLTTADAKTSHVPEGVSPDGRTLLYSAIDGVQATLWTVQWPGGNPKRVEGISSASPLGAALSPDGRWLAYATRRAEDVASVFVEPYPPTGAKYQVTRLNEDGHHPLWSPDGSRLYYVPGPNGFVSVGVEFRPTPVFGAPAPAPRGFFNANRPFNVRGHDISPDGKRFVGVAETGVAGVFGAKVFSIEVVRNWLEELKQRVPVK